MSTVALRRVPERSPLHLHVVRGELGAPRAEAEVVDADPENVLRHHVRETQRLASRILRFQEDLVLATEAGFLDNPEAAVKALRELERTRASVAQDIRETSKVLHKIILERYRANYPPEPPQGER